MLGPWLITPDQTPSAHASSFGDCVQTSTQCSLIWCDSVSWQCSCSLSGQDSTVLVLVDGIFKVPTSSTGAPGAILYLLDPLRHDDTRAHLSSWPPIRVMAKGRG